VRAEIKKRAEMIRKGEVPDGYKKTKVGIIPREWEEMQLKKHGETYSGLSGKNKEDFGSGKPYIPYKNIFLNSKIDVEYLDYVRLSESEKQHKVQYGDIFFTTSSEIPEETGLSSVLLDNIQSECYLNSFCFGYRLHNFKSLSPHFLRFFLRGEHFRRSIIRLAQGSTRFNISKKFILNLFVFVPSLPEQTTIAQILSTADKAIETTETLITLKEQKKKWLMQNLLTGKVRLPEYDNCPVPVPERIRMIRRGDVPEGYKQTKVGIIPVEWEEKRLKDVLFLQNGYAFKSSKFIDKGIPIIRISNIKENNIDFTDLVFYKEDGIPKKFIIKDNDVMIAMSGATTGKIGVYKSKEKAYQNQRVGKFVVTDKDTFSLYISHLVISDNFKKSISLDIIQGAQPNISSKQIEKKRFAFPNTYNEQKIISNILSTADKEIDLLNQKLEKLKEQKKALMQLLLTGIVRTTGLNLSTDTEKEGVAYAGK